MLTNGGLLLTRDADYDTYTVTKTSDTLTSGLEYMSKFPDDGPEFPAVLFCHSLEGSRADLDNDFHPFKYVSDRLASLGFYCVIGSCGNHYGNDTFRAQCDELVEHAESAGAAADQVVTVGLSQGGVVLSWVADGNLTKVICHVAVAPITSMSNFYDNGSSGAKAEIDAAYGGDWASAAAAHDPLLLAQAGAFDGLPGKIWYGSEDTTCPPEDAEALVAEIPTFRSVEVQGNHFAATATMLFHSAAIWSYIIGQYRPLATQRRLLTA